MNKMNTLAFVNFLLVKLFPTLIRQNFPLSKICAVQYSHIITYYYYSFNYYCASENNNSTIYLASLQHSYGNTLYYVCS